MVGEANAKLKIAGISVASALVGYAAKGGRGFLFTGALAATVSTTILWPQGARIAVSKIKKGAKSVTGSLTSGEK